MASKVRERAGAKGCSAGGARDCAQAVEGRTRSSFDRCPFAPAMVKALATVEALAVLRLSGARRKSGPMRCQILDGQLFRRFPCVLKYVRGASRRLGAKSW